MVCGSPLWESPLPMDRYHFQGGEIPGGIQAGFSHGDYFSAARRFIEEDGLSILSGAPFPESFQNPTDVDICLMKHGECYHPAKITVTGGGCRQSFVLNVAVSDPGRRIIGAEIAALQRLGGSPGPSFVPRVYGQGGVPISGGPEVRMFLGEWFEGFHEFHLSTGDSPGVCVWGEQDIPIPLSTEAAYLLYHQAASILTRYYNPATTEQIACWHHASGDFVVQCRENRVDARLITVRHYGPLLNSDDAPNDPARQSEQALSALLLFLIGLSIRMRLDRLEGIGDMAWADDTAVIGTWTGFLEGLSNCCFPAPFLPDPVHQFKRHLAGYGETDFRDLIETMATALPVGPAEKAMIETHLPSHMETLFETICRIGFP